MTLFETEAPLGDLSARRAAHLPSPHKSRFAPLRAGILNVWEYDDQQFWFVDGRLLLRGRNEAGKSKVLELLFPFVLDGDITPKKLDPFDTANKSMWWNMIGFHKERSSAIGYLWIEFGRLEQTSGTAEYLTAIVGVQATRAERKVPTWFALTPQRVDLDLDLAPGEVCRTQDSLSKALVPGACFETKASAHRANVATRLFGMSPERFDNLLHLLRQLRKPKLADKLDNKKLSDVLTKALPPLDETRIEPLATGFSYLDADITDLARAEEAWRATGAFLEVYRTYSRGQARHRANRVISAVTNFDNVTRAENAATTELEKARQESTRLTGELTRIAHRLAEASGSLESLDLTAVDTLRSLEQQKNSDRTVASTTEGESSRARKAADDAAASASEAESDLAESQVEEHGAVDTARRTAGKAGIEDGWERSEDGATRATALSAAVRNRRALVEAVATAEARASKARERVAASKAELDAAVEHLDEAADTARQAGEKAEAARAEFVNLVEAWAASAPGLVEVSGENVAADVEAALAGGDRAARRIAQVSAATLLERADQAVADATEGVANAKAARNKAVADLATHNALPDETPPPRRAGIPQHRSGTPLWRIVEFDEALDGQEKAFLEAALDAAGLLDAAVTGDGLVRADDTVILAGGGGRGIGDWLRLAEGSEHDLVSAALAAVGAGPDSGAACWVDLDGTWANGPLRGRWTKPQAEHIGAAARAAARARRRQELSAEVIRTQGALDDAEGARAAAEESRRQVLEWKDEFPSVTQWSIAARELAMAATAEARAQRQHANKLDAHNNEIAASRAAFDAVDAAVRAAGCRPGEVAELRSVLDAAAECAQDLRVAARDTSLAAALASRLRGEASRLVAEAEAADARHQTAALAFSKSSAAYKTAYELQGADVQRVLAEKDRLEAEVVGLSEAQIHAQQARNDARESEVRAESQLQEIGRRRQEASQERDLVLTQLAALVRSGHVNHAVVIDADRDPAEYAQATAGRNLARQIATAVPAEDASEESRSRSTDRLIAGFTPLQDAIRTAFDPHLDSTDTGVFSASATLNGEVITIAELHTALEEDVTQRRATIEAHERNLIEQYLRDEVGNHLGDCLHAAKTQVDQMNDILKRHPTNSGATVQLRWQVSDDAGPGVKDAVQALLRIPATRAEQESASLAVFLTGRVDMARRGEVDGADLAERLISALDYRTWYTFRVTYRAGGTESALTARSVGSGSGGQQAKVAHLPLLAAAAGFYSSSPSAPRLCFLDEAFAGIDGPNTADLLAVSATLNLDMVMTNFDAWFCVPEVPGLAIYHLEKLAGAVGVAAIRYEWDGHTQTDTDPWLAAWAT